MASRVPLSLDHRTIDQHFERDPRTRLTIQDDALSELSKAFAAAHDLGSKIEGAASAIMSDESRPLAQRQIDAKMTIKVLAEQATRRLDGARARAAKELEQIAQDSAPPSEPRNAQEIRNALRSLPRAERAQIIAVAIEQGDHATISSMLNAPSWLSGLTEEERAMRQHGWRAKHHADALAREQRLKAAMEDFDRGGRAFLDFVAHVTPQADAAVAAAKAANNAIHDATQNTIANHKAAAE
ncbi:MAG: hypothetical protein Q8M31_21275 [Beijerinckiaceae bacterium]|nr:hypothetical protein [Beijerinckiaceae bacterium]